MYLFSIKDDFILFKVWSEKFRHELSNQFWCYIKMLKLKPGEIFVNFFNNSIK